LGNALPRGSVLRDPEMVKLIGWTEVAAKAIDRLAHHAFQLVLACHLHPRYRLDPRSRATPRR